VLIRKQVNKAKQLSRPSSAERPNRPNRGLSKKRNTVRKSTRTLSGKRLRKSTRWPPKSTSQNWGAHFGVTNDSKLFQINWSSKINTQNLLNLFEMQFTILPQEASIAWVHARSSWTIECLGKLRRVTQWNVYAVLAWRVRIVLDLSLQLLRSD